MYKWSEVNFVTTYFCAKIILSVVWCNKDCYFTSPLDSVKVISAFKRQHCCLAFNTVSQTFGSKSLILIETIFVLHKVPQHFWRTWYSQLWNLSIVCTPVLLMDHLASFEASRFPEARRLMRSIWQFFYICRFDLSLEVEKSEQGLPKYKKMHNAN